MKLQGGKLASLCRVANTGDKAESKIDGERTGRSHGATEQSILRWGQRLQITFSEKFEPCRIALKRTATQRFRKYNLLLDEKKELYWARKSISPKQRFRTQISVQKQILSSIFMKEKWRTLEE